jgi:hypothetical protein
MPDEDKPPLGLQGEGLPAATLDVNDAAAATPVTIDGFISSFRKKLDQPIILSLPRLRKTRTVRQEIDNEALVPKRSVCLATKSRYRELKPEAQARKVMMKKIGLEIETALPDEALFEEFQSALILPLSSSTREAMQVLFHGGSSGPLEPFAPPSVLPVGLISPLGWPNDHLGLDLAPLSGAPDPSMAGGPPSHCAIKRGGGRWLVARGSPKPQSPLTQTLTPI